MRDILYEYGRFLKKPMLTFRAVLFHPVSISPPKSPTSRYSDPEDNPLVQ